jgi:hypothetical protein
MFFQRVAGPLGKLKGTQPYSQSAASIKSCLATLLQRDMLHVLLFSYLYLPQLHAHCRHSARRRSSRKMEKHAAVFAECCFYKVMPSNLAAARHAARFAIFLPTSASVTYALPT